MEISDSSISMPEQSMHSTASNEGAVEHDDCCDSGAMAPLSAAPLFPDNNEPVWELSLLWSSLFFYDQNTRTDQLRTLSKESASFLPVPPPLFIENCAFLI